MERIAPIKKRRHNCPLSSRMVISWRNTVSGAIASCGLPDAFHSEADRNKYRWRIFHDFKPGYFFSLICPKMAILPVPEYKSQI
jgi:hypothetical protein